MVIHSGGGYVKVKKRTVRWIAPSRMYVVKTLHRLDLNGLVRCMTPLSSRDLSVDAGAEVSMRTTAVALRKMGKRS